MIYILRDSIQPDSNQTSPPLPLAQTVFASSVNCPARKGVSAEEVECTQSADDGLRPQNRLRVRLNMPNLLKTLLRDQANTTTES